MGIDPYLHKACMAECFHFTQAKATLETIESWDQLIKQVDIGVATTYTSTDKFVLD